MPSASLSPTTIRLSAEYGFQSVKDVDDESFRTPTTSDRLSPHSSGKEDFPDPRVSVAQDESPSTKYDPMFLENFPRHSRQRRSARPDRTDSPSDRLSSVRYADPNLVDQWKIRVLNVDDNSPQCRETVTREEESDDDRRLSRELPSLKTGRKSRKSTKSQKRGSHKSATRQSHKSSGRRSHKSSGRRSHKSSGRPSHKSSGGRHSRNQRPSNISTKGGKKRALLIGINYEGIKNVKLRGCITDTMSLGKLLVSRGWKEEDMGTLTDHTPDYLPTRENILRACKWLVKDAAPGDVFFFHYSGHGTQEVDPNGFEDDGLNEVIVPLDFMKEGMISDDELNRILIRDLPEGVKLFAIIDACHSGSMLDLPYQWSGRNWKEDVNPLHSKGDVVMLSGSKDSEVAADGKSGGAMTESFVSIMKRNNERSKKFVYSEVLDDINKALRKGRFAQRPVLSSSQRFDAKKRPFYLATEHKDAICPNSNKKIGRITRHHFRDLSEPMGKMASIVMMIIIFVVALGIGFGIGFVAGAITGGLIGGGVMLAILIIAFICCHFVFGWKTDDYWPKVRGALCCGRQRPSPQRTPKKHSFMMEIAE